MATPVIATHDPRRDAEYFGADLAAKRRTYNRFVVGVFVFAAHVLVILGLLALFRG
jgi:hypothetical protein